MKTTLELLPQPDGSVTVTLTATGDLGDLNRIFQAFKALEVAPKEKAFPEPPEVSPTGVRGGRLQDPPAVEK
jgi:hypothetical protein